MKIKPMHKNFKLPVRSTSDSGGYDIFMPEAGKYSGENKIAVRLGFATEVPVGYVAILLPRSGKGFQFGVELNNTAGIIDADFRGEWVAAIKTKNREPIEWEEGDRLLQFIIVPVLTPELEISDTLSLTARDQGGMGSTGK